MSRASLSALTEPRRAATDNTANAVERPRSRLGLSVVLRFIPRLKEIRVHRSSRPWRDCHPIKSVKHLSRSARIVYRRGIVTFCELSINSLDKDTEVFAELLFLRRQVPADGTDTSHLEIRMFKFTARARRGRVSLIRSSFLPIAPPGNSRSVFRHHGSRSRFSWSITS